MAATVSTKAWLKALLHAAKHEECEVNGLLLGEATAASGGGGRPSITVVDACPLFHHPTAAPTLEAATLMVEQYGASQSPKLSIVGYYHANKRAKTHTLGLVASRIASKVVANCPGAAICLLDPDLVPFEPHRCLRLCEVGDGEEGLWRPTDRSLKVQNSATATAATLAAKLDESSGDVGSIVDFDDHFDDLTADWRNPGLVVDERAAGGEAEESKGGEL